MNKTTVLNTLFGVLLFTAGIGLLLGLYAGLIRLGILLPSALEIGAMAHGPLMINGFLGTLISLERGAALEKLWTYIAPMSFALSTILLMVGFAPLGGYFLILGTITLFLIMGYLCYIQSVNHHYIMAGGALALLIGNLLFIFQVPIYGLIGWWIAFPLLTIFGERLELNRIMRPPQKAVNLFSILIIGWFLTLAGVHFQRNLFWMIGSLFLIGIAAWLIRYDVARKTIKMSGWTKYSAWSLLTGYGWIIVGGMIGIVIGMPKAGALYDAILHIYFVGFVFSMIFAHAAVIIPSLTGKIVPYSRYFYLPLILLHGCLILRIAGDLFFWDMIRKIGSYGNIAAILLFLGGIMIQLIRSRYE
ncbi:hypothetical protein [Rhodohalobacter halophilus]|uniref:hypothetical protein n=1 Tax=Rhodohalobacter halophilus TaxID=1812810 RepID=UPI00083FA3B4|nr:hypothetical protein [Rhodohalobacter halophilus]